MVIRYRWRPAASYRKGRTGPISAIILHSTDGREQGDIETLTRGPVSVHWYVTRSGDVWHFVDDADTAYHVGQADAEPHRNGRTIGIEQEHIDGKDDWPDAQLASVAMIVAFERQRFGDIKVLSHASVAYPHGRKIDPADYPWDALREAVAALKSTPITAERIDP